MRSRQPAGDGDRATAELAPPRDELAELRRLRRVRGRAEAVAGSSGGHGARRRLELVPAHDDAGPPGPAAA